MDSLIFHVFLVFFILFVFGIGCIMIVIQNEHIDMKHRRLQLLAQKHKEMGDILSSNR